MEVVYIILGIVGAFGLSGFLKNRKIANLKEELADSELENSKARREALKKDVENAKLEQESAKRKFESMVPKRDWRPGEGGDPQP